MDKEPEPRPRGRAPGPCPWAMPRGLGPGPWPGAMAPGHGLGPWPWPRAMARGHLCGRHHLRSPPSTGTTRPKMEKKIEPWRHFAPPLPPECNVARAFRVGRRVEEINRTLCRLAWTALCRQHCIRGARGAGLGHRRVRLFLPSTVSNRAIILECLVFMS